MQPDVKSKLHIKELTNDLYGLVYNDKVWEACNTSKAEDDKVYMKAN